MAILFGFRMSRFFLHRKCFEVEAFDNREKMKWIFPTSTFTYTFSFFGIWKKGIMIEDIEYEVKREKGKERNNENQNERRREEKKRLDGI